MLDTEEKSWYNARSVSAQKKREVKMKCLCGKEGSEWSISGEVIYPCPDCKAEVELVALGRGAEIALQSYRALDLRNYVQPPLFPIASIYQVSNKKGERNVSDKRENRPVGAGTMRQLALFTEAIYVAS